MTAQTVALEHPDRVLTLTSWGSTPFASAQIWGGHGLPGMEQKVKDAFEALLRPAAGDEERIERFAALHRAFAGTLEEFDEQEARRRVKRAVDHTREPEAAQNHFLAGASASDRTEALAKITVPTLVIHGTVDPAVPLPHGEATAKAIPGARLLTIDGMGHDFPRAALPQIIDAILEHTSKIPVRS
jgi:pimeloyl-ACP methyl ester carboxylesterase